MKTKVVFLALCMIFTIMLSGQNHSKELLEVEVTPPKFTGIENVMEFENGLYSKSITHYIASIFEAPVTNHTLEGTEVVAFTITETGKISDIKIINSVSRAVDKEIIDALVSTEGKWRPGYNNGNPVAMEKEIALEIVNNNFEPNINSNDFERKAVAYFNKGTENLFTKGKVRRAMKNFDNGIRYRPYDQSLHYMRGVCRYELGQVEGARQDWMRLKELGGLDVMETYAQYDIKDFKAYEELTTMFLTDEK